MLIIFLVIIIIWTEYIQFVTSQKKFEYGRYKKTIISQLIILLKSFWCFLFSAKHFIIFVEIGNLI